MALPLTWHSAVRADFDSGYSRIAQVVEALSSGQLLEPGHYEWTGKHPLTTYIGPNTASHYRFAIKAIKRWLKGTAGTDTSAARPNKRLQPPKSRIGTARKQAPRPRLRGRTGTLDGVANFVRNRRKRLH